MACPMASVDCPTDAMGNVADFQTMMLTAPVSKFESPLDC